MKYWNQLIADKRILIISLVVNVMLFIIIVLIEIDHATKKNDFTCYIPPDISNGATIVANKIPTVSVGEFTFYVWQILNNWQTNGEQDYKKAINTYGYYTSPSFRYYLNKNMKNLQDNGQLQGRTRTILPVYGDAPKVIKLNANTWQVILIVRETESVNGITVKDKEIQYPFKVIRYNGNAQYNPFGLVLDGFTSQPEILKTIK